ncbi:MAG: VWA domain-containing protein [Ignavibacteriae bacterium]|nr:VWA domain-containing protein [Ignavibacteriota bacterium]
MIRHFRFILQSVAALLCAFALFAETAQAQLSISIDTLDASQFPTIRAKVKVRSGSSALTGLSVANFTVFEDGLIQAPVTGGCDDTAQSGPVSVMLIIDKSNSMGPIIGSNAIVDAKSAATKFVDRLGAGDEAALLSFNDSPSYDQNWTADKTLLKNRINAIRTSGGTAVWDAIITGAIYMRGRVNRKVMIVLTDGVDTESNSSFNAARDSVQKNNVRVYSIGLGNNINTSELRSLATATGGRYYNAPSGADLDQIYQDITNQITPTGICELRYQSRLTCLDGSLHRVEIEVRHSNMDDRDNRNYTLPYDSTSFSYITLASDADLAVDAGASITVPLQLTRVSSNRPPRLFRFDVIYDTTLVRLDSVTRSRLTTGYSITTAALALGRRITLNGSTAVRDTGILAFAHFSAHDRTESVKTPFVIQAVEVDPACTITAGNNSSITINGVCRQAVQRAPIRSTQKSVLLAVSPNPFNPVARIRYRLALDGPAVLRLYDTFGRLVRETAVASTTAGEHQTVVDGGGLASGSYLLEFIAPDSRDTRRISLLK